MVNFDGQWKIVNVLWVLGPDSPRRPPLTDFNPENEKHGIETAAKEYHEGIFTGDVARLEEVIHPEIIIAGLRKAPKTGRYMVSRDGASGLLEYARAKISAVPEGQRHVTIIILDIMDAMAFVKTATSKATSYLQLQKIDERWQIVNILSVPIS